MISRKDVAYPRESDMKRRREKKRGRGLLIFD